MKLNEKENLFQAVFVVAIVLLKRFYGSALGEYENIIFCFHGGYRTICYQLAA